MTLGRTAKVRKHHSTLIEQDVGGLHVPVANGPFMEMRKSQQQLRRRVLGQRLEEHTSALNQLLQGKIEALHAQCEVVTCLKCKGQLHNVGMIYLRQNVALSLDVLEELLLENH